MERCLAKEALVAGAASYSPMVMEGRRNTAGQDTDLVSDRRSVIPL